MEKTSVVMELLEGLVKADVIKSVDDITDEQLEVLVNVLKDDREEILKKSE